MELERYILDPTLRKKDIFIKKSILSTSSLDSGYDSTIKVSSKNLSTETLISEEKMSAVVEHYNQITKERPIIEKGPYSEINKQLYTVVGSSEILQCPPLKQEYKWKVYDESVQVSFIIVIMKYQQEINDLHKILYNNNDLFTNIVTALAKPNPI